MTRDELLARLKGYEWSDFECKKAQRGVPNDAYVTVSAFANSAGGWRRKVVQPTPDKSPDKSPDKLPDKYPASTQQVPNK